MNIEKYNDIKKYEENKQGKEYLSYMYSENRRPVTDYPYKLAKEIIKRNNIKKNSELLDVGCGRGDMLKAFIENGINVQGVDLSEESSRMLLPIKVHQKNLENETLEDKKDFFDVVFSKSLIEHLHSPLAFLKNCKSLLKKNGRLIIMTPSWYHHSFGPFYLDHTHVTPFTLQSLRDIVILAGFSKVNVKYFYQLPFTWKYPPAKIVPKLISALRLPYMPMYEGLSVIKFPKKFNTLIRFSREVMLYGEIIK
jgi:2-polyprenyl-3-methyl-5-hydroxy-6-metoxy-1,4-benzoquinol methylase